MKDKEDIDWSAEQDQVMNNLVEEICNQGLLLPRYGEEFIITADFSYAGIGGMLS